MTDTVAAVMRRRAAVEFSGGRARTARRILQEIRASGRSRDAICAWCKCSIPGIAGSHGICAPCASRLMGEDS